MYAVTGATGQLGQLVIEALLERVAPARIVALVRDPARAADLAAKGVTLRRFDYDRPETLGPALAGVSRLLLISSNDLAARTAQHRAVVEAAKAAGPELFVYTSLLHADTSPLSLAESHLATEAMIVEAGLPHAILRNGWYIENYLPGADVAIEHGVLVGSSGKGRISAAARADYAEAAAIALTGPVAGNVTLELAGDEAFTLADVAAALSDAAGKPVVYQDLPEATYRDVMIQAGLPEGFAAALAEYSAKAAEDCLFDASRGLSGLIGRPTARMHDVILAALKP